VAHRNKLLYLRDFTIDTTDIDDENTIDTKTDKRFVYVKLKEYFDLIRKDQGIEVRKYKNIDEEYEEIMNKSKKKAFSFSVMGGSRSKEVASRDKKRPMSILLD